MYRFNIPKSILEINALNYHKYQVWVNNASCFQNEARTSKRFQICSRLFSFSFSHCARDRYVVLNQIVPSWLYAPRGLRGLNPPLSGS